MQLSVCACVGVTKPKADGINPTETFKLVIPIFCLEYYKYIPGQKKLYVYTKSFIQSSLCC